MENQQCQRCDNNKLLHSNSLNLSPVYLGFLPIDGNQRNMIMAMGQVFDDQRRMFKGYWIYFYPDEFIPPNPKSLSLLHIHFFDERGEIRVYLSDSKHLDIDEKWGYIPNHNRTKIIRFVQQNLLDIMNKVENELRRVGIKN